MVRGRKGKKAPPVVVSAADRKRVSSIRAKKKAGKELNPDEAALLRDYYRQYNSRYVKLYFESAKEEKEIRRVMDKDGATNFSRWVLGTLRLAMQGNFVTKETKEAQDELLARLRDEVKDLRATKDDLREELRKTQDRLQTVVDEYGAELWKNSPSAKGSGRTFSDD